MTTYYRISPRPMTEADLHEDHVSALWVGEDDERRRGMSACESYEDLVGYFAADGGRGARYDGAMLVELEGVLSDDDPWEPEGEVLIHPTRIVSQVPVADGFVGDVVDHINHWEYPQAYADYRAAYDASQTTIIIEVRCDHCDGTGHDEDEEDGECVWCGAKGWEARR